MITDGGGLDATNPAIIDLSPIGGSATQQMYDDGTHGDVTSADDIYSVTTTVSTDTAEGDYDLYITAKDAGGLLNDTEYISLNVALRNIPPVITEPLANLTQVPNDGVTEVLLSANVTDQNTAAGKMLRDVVIDLAYIGGTNSTPMLDNGINGDLTAGDDIYSTLTTVSTSTSEGPYQLMITARDWADAEANENITVNVGIANYAPVLSGPKAVPDSIPNDGVTETLLSVGVTDADAGDAHTVSIDLSSVGGSSTQQMNDAGTDGDETADDGTFSYAMTVPESINPAEYTLQITAKDDGINPVDVFENITITVTQQPRAPKIVETGASSTTVPNDGETLLDLFTTVTDEDGDIDKVSLDLTPIGGLSEESMSDDDEDGIYTISITVDPDVAPGTYELNTTAVDKTALKAEDSIEIVVEAAPVVNHLPVVSETLATPASVPNDDTTETTLSVMVSDDNGIADIETVTIDLGDIGGGVEEMTDDGPSTDEYKHRFVVVTTVPSDIAAGDYELYLTITDGVIADGSNTVDTAYITLTVTETGTEDDDTGDDDTQDDDTKDEEGNMMMWGIIIVAAILIIVIIIILIVVFRRKKESPADQVPDKGPSEEAASVQVVDRSQETPEETPSAGSEMDEVALELPEDGIEVSLDPGEGDLEIPLEASPEISAVEPGDEMADLLVSEEPPVDEIEDPTSAQSPQVLQVECSNCGEIMEVTVTESPMTIQCGKCGEEGTIG
jgi:5-hydroxyisourate hydrolase-like protein (transthyretin family)